MKKKAFALHDGTKVVLNICTEPHDYIKMFDVQCGSCMVISDHDPGQRIWPHMVAQNKVHPASWYHFTPHSRGVFITVNGTPIARCMQYRTDLRQNKWPLFSDIKYIAKKDAMLLVQIMRAIGCHYWEESMNNKMRTLVPFTVPGYESGLEDEGVLCPLPHCDMQEKDFSVTYDENTKVFTFWPYYVAPKNAYRILSTYNHDGFLRASEVLAREKRKPRAGGVRVNWSTLFGDVA